MTLGSCASDTPGPLATAPATSLGVAGPQGPVVGDVAPQGPVLLAAPDATGAATLAQAADVVLARLRRMGVGDAVVKPESNGVSVTSSADAYQLHAAAQQDASVIAPINSTALGPCGDSSTALGSVGPVSRCYTVGESLVGVGAVTAATVDDIGGAGWRAVLTLDPTQYKTFRAALEPAAGKQLALVAGGVVVLAFMTGVPALSSMVGPPLAEDQARLAAATFGVDSDLPVGLIPPALPPPTGPRVSTDFWTAALGVWICGAWLDNAPPFGLDTGLHSHGDGLVYLHPFMEDEAGDRATLGLFFGRGGWKVSADLLALWDGVGHASGSTCPDGRTASVRWWVDGVEQHGDPSTFRPHNGEVVVLAFDADAPPGPPPQMAALFMPSLGPAVS
jgi:hypothetical protein